MGKIVSATPAAHIPQINKLVNSYTAPRLKCLHPELPTLGSGLLPPS